MQDVQPAPEAHSNTPVAVAATQGTPGAHLRRGAPPQRLKACSGSFYNATWAIERETGADYQGEQPQRALPMLAAGRWAATRLEACLMDLE